MTKITTKSKEMLTNHIITLCREGNGNKGIPNQIKSNKIENLKKEGEKILLMTNTYQSYILVPDTNLKICKLEKFTGKYTVHS